MRCTRLELVTVRHRQSLFISGVNTRDPDEDKHKGKHEIVLEESG